VDVDVPRLLAEAGEAARAAIRGAGFEEVVAARW
jgi:hypothetical protein